MYNRESEYDYLRVFSMLAVIMMHVSVHWIDGFSYAVFQGTDIEELIHPFAACMYYSLSAFAVPCFIMVSGAFILDNDNNADYARFYKKSFQKIGVPTLIFTGLYSILNILELAASGNLSLDGLKEIVINDISGWPYYHMWYMFMIIGIYLLAPFMVIIKNKTGYGSFRKISIVFFVYSVVSAWTYKGNTVNWDIGYVIYFLGYFMIGYVLRKETKRTKIPGLVFLIMGILVEANTAFVYYDIKFIKGLDGAEKFLKPLSPLMAMAAILIFYGFGRLRLKYSWLVEKTAGLSFIIYMFHGGVWGGVKTIIGKIKGEYYLIQLDNIWAIPIGIAVVFLISVLLSLAYEKVYSSARQVFTRRD
ncbi:acyltransferase [Lachnospiraceae bacterium C1.1]|nr:acyltransferase [Lachnospiraceae bacterium C1.1]